MVNILTLSFGPREHMDSSSSQTAARNWLGIEGCYFLIKGGNFPEKAVLEPSRQFPDWCERQAGLYDWLVSMAFSWKLL